MPNCRTGVLLYVLGYYFYFCCHQLLIVALEINYESLTWHYVCNVMYKYKFTFDSLVSLYETFHLIILPYRTKRSTICDLYAANLKGKVQNHIS